MIALDDFFPPDQRIDLVKMDIQGAEGMALAGMKRVIKSNPDLMIVLEFWPSGLREAGSSPEGTLEGLQEHGFTVEQIDRRSGELRNVQSLAGLVKALPGNRYTNLLARPKILGRSV
jgi:hypothetical protein